MTGTNDGIMNDAVKELVAIGASVAAHCQPCLEYHLQASIELGIGEDDIRQAIEVGHAVERGAGAAMRKFSAAAVRKLFGAAQSGAFSGKDPETASERRTSETVLRIYEPAMCCSSGVCGPSVDPVLAQFSGTLNFVSAQLGVRVERYNLGQQPQAFVENAVVKSMLGNGGEKMLPFIFINDRLWLRGRYPSKNELLQALKIKDEPALSPASGTPENGPCCNGGGCC